jgi:hypothetical protein
MIAPALKKGAILTDVGSVKQAVIRDLGPYVPPGVHFVPGHPVAGTEHSGPESGFAELFCRPLVHRDPAARDRIGSGDRRHKNVGAGRHAGRHDECRPSRQGAGGDLAPAASDRLHDRRHRAIIEAKQA